jgi:cytosine/adenosine deaminase-related metal-dependent hydrolase
VSGSRKDNSSAARGAKGSSRRDVLLAGALAASQPLVPALAQAQAGVPPDNELLRIQRSRRILLKGGVVLSLDRAVGEFASADVLVENGKIRDIKPNIAADSSLALVDARNRILVPGFVDTHVHAYQGLLRTSLPSGVVDPDYNRDVQNSLTPAYAPEDVHAGELITALAMIDMGTTCIVDISQISHTPEHTDACIAALKESGIRAVHAYSRGSGPRTRYPDDVERLKRTYFNSEDQLLSLALATSTDAMTFRAARASGLRAVLHIRLNPQPLLALGRQGLLKPGDEFIHCAHLNDEAWRLIRDTGGRTSHSPPLEMAMGHGYPAIQEALDHGLRPSLSSDHSATVAQDMFGIMRAAFNLQRLSVLQRARVGEKNLPPLLNPREVLEFATIEGARCAALDRKVGTLTPGKDADILMLRYDRLDVWPLNNAHSAVVNLMNPSHIDAVLIAGKVRKWRGALVGIDTDRAMREAAAARERVMRRAGFKVELVG